MHRLNISYKQFYVTLNEIWLFESDPNAPSTWSERGGKQWQRSIRGRRNWDVELGPCAAIRHLCSVAFVWETKRPQADNSRSLIDRQVSCFCYVFKGKLKLFIILIFVLSPEASGSRRHIGELLPGFTESLWTEHGTQSSDAAENAL